MDDTAGETAVRSDSGETGDAKAETAGAVGAVGSPDRSGKEEEAKATCGGR